MHVENLGARLVDKLSGLTNVTVSCDYHLTPPQSFCDRNRTSKVFNHLMTVKEGIGCLGWVTVVGAATLFNAHLTTPVYTCTSG